MNPKAATKPVVSKPFPRTNSGAQVKADAATIVGAPSSERIELLERKISTIGGAFHLYTPEEIAEILNEAEFLRGSGLMIGLYALYLAETTDLKSLIAALAPLKSAYWKLYFLEEIFKKSPLLTPDNFKILSEICKSSGELEKLGSAAGSRILKAPPQDRLKLAQAFLDSGAGDECIKQIVGASVLALDSLNPNELETWLLGLPAEISEAGDAALLRKYAKREPEAGVAFLQKIIDQGSKSRSQAAAYNFGCTYAFAEPQKAFQWALQLPETFRHARLQTLVFAFSSLVKKDADEAASVLQQIKDPYEHERLASILADNSKN